MGRLLLVSFIWAFSFGLTKGRLQGIDPSLVAALRLGLAWLVFLPWLLRRPPPAQRLGSWMLTGAVQFGLMYLALMQSYRTLPAHLVALFTCTTPLWVILLTAKVGQRRRAWAAGALAVLAAALLTIGPGAVNANLLGLAWVQVANLAFAWGQVRYQREGERPWSEAVLSFAWMYTGAWLLSSAVALGHLLLTGASWPTFSAAQILTLLYLGILASGVCFFLWNEGASRVSGTTLAVMNNTKVPLGVACSLLFFGEQARLFPLLVAGTLLVLALALGRRSVECP